MNESTKEILRNRLIDLESSLQQVEKDIAWSEKYLKQNLEYRDKIQKRHDEISSDLANA